jgi:hypothetical protein
MTPETKFNRDTEMELCSNCRRYKIPIINGQLQAFFTRDDKFKKWAICRACSLKLR